MSEAKAGNTAKGGITVSVECLDRMTAAAIEADKKVRAFADAVGCGQPPQEWYDEDMDGLWYERGGHPVIILQRIADEEFRLLLDEAPEEMQSVADVVRAKYRLATDGMERPRGMRERVKLRRTVSEQAFDVCKERGLLQGLAERLGFPWQQMLWWVVVLIAKQLIEEWF